MLSVGDDWAEDHHGVELVDEAGRRLARARLPEGLEGISRLHALIATHMPAEFAELDPAEAAAKVRIGIETDRGPWVQALVAAGYQVYPINPVQVARYRQRHSTSGAKSDAGDARVLAEIVRLDHTHHRPLAGDSADAEAIKLVARTHQTVIWERSRHLLRLRSALRKFFPARWWRSTTWTPRTRWSCWAAPPTRSGGFLVAGADRRRTAASQPAATSTPKRRSCKRCCVLPSCANHRRCTPPTRPS